MGLEEKDLVIYVLCGVGRGEKREVWLVIDWEKTQEEEQM